MFRYLLAGIALCALVGCGQSSGPKLLPVHGMVTLDGKPVTGAFVHFTPAKGRPSYGETDESGYYELGYTQSRQGALVTSHTVSISTYRDAVTLEGKVLEKAVRESIPKRYNRETELTAEVEPGNTEFNFELSSR